MCAFSVGHTRILEYIYSRTRLVRTRDKTYFGLVRTHFSEPKFIYYIDSYVISTRLVRTYG